MIIYGQNIKVHFGDIIFNFLNCDLRNYKKITRLQLETNPLYYYSLIN